MAELAPALASHGVFHLLPVPLLPQGVAQEADVASPAAPVLEVPAGEVLILPADGAGPALAFEAVERNGADLLLALSAEHTPLLVNGLLAPCLVLLRPGDEVRVGARPPLVVDFLRASPFLLADAAQAQGRCQLCRDPIALGRRIFRCPCGALLHAEEPQEASAQEPLFCAFGSCTACQRPVQAQSGYVHHGDSDDRQP